MPPARYYYHHHHQRLPPPPLLPVLVLPVLVLPVLVLPVLLLVDDEVGLNNAVSAALKNALTDVPITPRADTIVMETKKASSAYSMAVTARQSRMDLRKAPRQTLSISTPWR